MLIQYILDAKMHNFGYKLIKIFSFCTCFPSKALFIDRTYQHWYCVLLTTYED